MKVNGTLTQEVTIEISPQEAFRALANAFNLEEPLCDSLYGTYWKVDEDENGKECLQCYKDESHHCSPQYEPVKGKKITHPDLIKAYKLMLELRNLIK